MNKRIFNLEKQALSDLSHDQIVQLLEVKENC